MVFRTLKYGRPIPAKWAPDLVINIINEVITPIL